MACSRVSGGRSRVICPAWEVHTWRMGGDDPTYMKRKSSVHNAAGANARIRDVTAPSAKVAISERLTWSAMKHLVLRVLVHLGGCILIAQHAINTNISNSMSARNAPSVHVRSDPGLSRSLRAASSSKRSARRFSASLISAVEAPSAIDRYSCARWRSCSGVRSDKRGRDPGESMT